VKAGRDLDCKLAVDLMGYRWITHLLKFSAELQVKWLGSADELADSGGVYITVKPEEFQSLKLREGYADSVPLYSTDLAAAQLVVKRLEELGYTFGQHREAGGIRVTFSSARGKGEAVSASAAEAIALAAVETMAT